MELKGTRKKDSNITHYKFEGDITINTVKELKKILTDELSRCSLMELDLNGIVKFDSAGFQLLVYLDREARKNNKELLITGKSMNVSKVFNLFNAAI